MAAKVAFEKVKFSISGVAPYTILQSIIPELAENVDFDLMLSRFDSIKQQNMIDLTQPVLNTKAAKVSKAPKNLRVYSLLGVFGSLTLILVFMVYNTFFNAPPKPDGTIKISESENTPVFLPTIAPTQIVPTGSTSTPAGETVIQL
jgi:hypothetical protein